jgi:hypothetical protein
LLISQPPDSGQIFDQHGFAPPLCGFLPGRIDGAYRDAYPEPDDLVAAVFRGTPIDSGVMILGLIGLSIPVFTAILPSALPII